MCHIERSVGLYSCSLNLNLIKVSDLGYVVAVKSVLLIDIGPLRDAIVEYIHTIRDFPNALTNVDVMSGADEMTI